MVAYNGQPANGASHSDGLPRTHPSYVATLCILGIGAFTWRLLPARMRPSCPYEVAGLEETGGALAITTKPKGRALRYRPGHFAFAGFGGSAPHPFTIGKAPGENGGIRMTVASLGDFTTRSSRSLTVGTGVRIEGPFGRFERPRSGKPELWIAGGIGITPFVAWAQATDRRDNPVHLVYCVRNEDSASHLQELAVLADEVPSLTLEVHASETSGRVTADTILETTGLDASSLSLAFCEPEPMRKALTRGFAARGVPVRKISYENFEIRSGTGLEDARRVSAGSHDAVAPCRRRPRVSGGGLTPPGPAWRHRSRRAGWSRSGHRRG